MTEKSNQTPESAAEEIQAEQAQAETTEQTAAPEGDQPSYEELAAALEKAQAKADENWDQVLRMRAELENTRRRAERDVEGAHKFALEKFVNELLPVKDSLEMGEVAAQAEGVDVEKVREGLALTGKMMTDVMAKFNVAEVNPVGDKFNPDLHQAMSMQDVPTSAPNTVVTVFQKGYTLNDRLIRPAMVVVASNNSGSALGDEPPKDAQIDEMA